MGKIKAEIKKIETILAQNLNIPGYQRPYRWYEENVRLLLQDIFESWKQGKKSYRAGSIILHQSGDDLSIVDGQQRVTTLLLILKVLGSNIGSNLRNKLNYTHADSKVGIFHNHQFIEKWVNENLADEKDDFSKYLTMYCEFVEIIVDDLSEAFQMFDSQNGRGKELETYNLLKAYHIRAMDADNHETKVECDRSWESATRNKDENGHVNDILKQIFNEQLYRTRVWSRKEEAYDFNKKRISEFKGLTISKHLSITSPFQNKELLQFVVNNYFQSIGVEIKGIKSRFKNKTLDNISPFVLINQNIINGKSFFGYIETYVEIYKQLFEHREDKLFLQEFKNFYHRHCIDYKGSRRDGDRYLKELYKSLIFILFDKYGEDGVLRFYKTLYILVYRERLGKMQIKYVAVAQYPAKTKLFSIIEQSNSFFDLEVLNKEAKTKVVCRKEVGEIITFFIDYGVSFDKEKSSVDLTKY